MINEGSVTIRPAFTPALCQLRTLTPRAQVPLGFKNHGSVRGLKSDRAGSNAFWIKVDINGIQAAVSVGEINVNTLLVLP